jgi:hypothetical protein
MKEWDTKVSAEMISQRQIHDIRQYVSYEIDWCWASFGMEIQPTLVGPLGAYDKGNRR